MCVEGGGVYMEGVCVVEEVKVCVCRGGDRVTPIPWTQCTLPVEHKDQEHQWWTSLQ